METKPFAFGAVQMAKGLGVGTRLDTPKKTIGKLEIR